MTLGNQTPDKTLLKNVTQKLTRIATGSRNQVTATVRSGDVTLTGTIGFEHQRRSIVRSASGVSGVRRVIDQLRLEPQKKVWA